MIDVQALTQTFIDLLTAGIVAVIVLVIMLAIAAWRPTSL